MKIRRLFRFSARSDEDIRRDLDDEFAFHLEMRTAELERNGLTHADALTQARREFGEERAGRATFVEYGRTVERRRGARRLISELKQDSSYGLRLFSRSPGFTLACIATLAVAIGGNTAVFAVVDAFFLKPAPIADPSALVRVRLGQSRMSAPVFEEVRRRTNVFSRLTAVQADMAMLGEPGEATRLLGERVSGDYFETLGVRAALGRTFAPNDSTSDVIVLSDRTWRSRFGADPAVVGRHVSLNRRSVEVIGVMPAGFRGLAPPGWIREFWIPLPPVPPQSAMRADAPPSLEAAGRLKAGISPEQAAAALRVAMQQLRADQPQLPESLTDVQLLSTAGIDAFRGVGAVVPVFMFVGLLGLIATVVLLIGCANIAGLLLGRAVARRHELALRAALGAGRGRLIRQLITESVLLALAGGAIGALVAVWLTRLVPLALSQLPFPIEFDLSLDARVLGFAAALSIVTALVFGLTPARRAVRMDLAGALRDAAPAGARLRLRQALVFTQVAACATLLTWGLLFTRSLSNIGAVNPGFDASGVLIADVSLTSAPNLQPERLEPLIVQVQDRVAQLPFVQSLGAAWAVPLSLSSRESFSVFTSEHPSGAGRVVNANRLTPGWFATLRIPLIAGRDFTWDDRPGSPEVAIVNRTLAEQFWNGQALGRRLTFVGARDVRHDVEIVGIVADSKYWTLGEAIEPAVYLPLRQDVVSTGLTLHIRTSNAHETSLAIARALPQVAPDASVAFKAMSEAIAVAVMPARVGAVVTGAFAAIAVLLAAVGIYALISQDVAQRTREIGVRRAVGATTRDVLRLVVGRSVLLVGTGLAVGMAIGVAGGTALSSLTVGVSPADPIALAAAATVVLGAAVIASVVPAARASRVDPLIALRAE
jgi:predicted permease